MSDIVNRKQQHIQLAMEQGSQYRDSIWQQYQLPYTALPEIDLKTVNTHVTLFGKTLHQPLIIASMTGGSAHAEQINTNLAQAAEALKVAMGVGSQRVALEKEDAKKTFQLVRKFAPTTVIFANMGVVQLNYGHTWKSYQHVVDMIEADALYLHINPIQEALQPEGDTNWEGLLPKIAQLVKKISVPVWVKEVGCGLDELTVRKLVECGVAGFDVAGVGGTSWTWIEGKRRNNERLTEWFADFGIKTDESVKRLTALKMGKPIVASGGVRGPIDGLKALRLGASFYSAARPFLQTALQSPEETKRLIQDWEDGLRIALFGMGVRNLNGFGLA